jgi:hypothetical protein
MSEQIPKEFELSIVLLILAWLYFRTASFEYAK